MRFDKNALLLYAVTDRRWVGEKTLYEQAEASLRGGATCLQLREKELGDAELLAEAKAFSALCKRYGVPFIVNDRVDIALAAGADGVHVGQGDLPVREVRKRIGGGMILGVTAHTVEEALRAERDGADYLGLGAVFPTGTKRDAEAMPFETLKAICGEAKLPTVAIGGITEENLLSLSGSGVDGIAVVSALFGADDPGKAAAKLAGLAREMIKR